MTGTIITNWLNTLHLAQRRRRVHFWGDYYIVRPILTQAVYGDGLQLIALSPIATRPNRYLVRVGSRQEFNTDDWIDLLWNIQNDIEEEFGPRHWTDDRGRLRTEDWPSPDWGNGCSWTTLINFGD